MKIFNKIVMAAMAVAASTTFATASGLVINGSKFGVTTNQGPAPSGTVLVRLVGTPYDPACGCSKNAVKLITSTGSTMYTATDGLTRYQLQEYNGAGEFAESEFPNMNVVLVDEVGGYVKPDGTKDR